ncbi:ABC transporter substrate-binding protein [Actinokineospora guangxiensis]|uniref:ABC transporter substrate-binding protein n=1 Tax=Actinokineospora guangxiensis TaxID=1490288 RepID=A0ABW0ESZ3_9PSEU
MRRAGRTRAAAGLLIGGLVLTACSGGGDGDQQTQGDPNAPVTLTINVFGDNFSLPSDRSVYDEYEKLNPNVTIVENRSDFGAHHQNLQARLTAGTGTADLELIEVGQVAGYVGQTEKFINFKDQGVDTSAWTDSTLARASNPDKTALIGLPTDIGGLAMCYRTDLFEQAGLPTARDEVSKLWPTWDAYVATGQKFLDKAPAKTKWFDAGGHTFTGILGNEQETFYNANGDLIVAQNPKVKDAWNLTVQAIKNGQSAALPEFTPEWNTGFQQGQFATITCPAWMMGYIKSNAKDTEGKWDIAQIPGGSGNWGGSYVSVPASGKNTAAAVELAKWLTAPEQAVKLFQKIGNFPSQKATWEQPEVKDFKAEFFNDAPAGTIFPASLANAPVQVAGPQSGVIGNTFATALNGVEQGGNPDEAWDKALTDIEAAAGTG